MRRLLFSVAAMFALSPGSAVAETPVPARFGDWEVYCFSGFPGNRQPVCNIDRIVQRPDAYGNETILYIKVSSPFDEHLTVYTDGRNRATCETLSLRESVRRGYSPHNTAPSEPVLTGLHARIATVLRSHVPMFGVCTAMGRYESDFPTDFVNQSASDLRHALEHVDQVFTRHRHLVNPVAGAGGRRLGHSAD